MRKGKQTTSFVKKYQMTKDELKVLKPLHQRRLDLSARWQEEEDEKKKGELGEKFNQITKDINQIIADIITKNVNPPSNIKYKSRFSIEQGWIKLKRLVDRTPLTPTNYQDVMGWGDK